MIVIINAKTVKIDNLTFYYQDTGKGESIVLVHGMASDHTVWDGLIPLLKENYRVISVDLRGHGYSSKPPGPYTMELFSQDLYRILESLDINKAHFVGHSMGGAVLQSLSLQYPEMISSLTFISSFAYIDSHLQEILKKLLKIVNNEGYNAFFDYCLKLANTPKFIEKNKELFRSIRDSNAQIVSIPAINATINACLEVNFIDSLKSIQTPTMVIVGDNDLFTPPYNGEKIKNNIANSKIEIMASMGHNLLVEKPEETFFLINSFLKEL